MATRYHSTNAAGSTSTIREHQHDKQHEHNTAALSSIPACSARARSCAVDGLADAAPLPSTTSPCEHHSIYNVQASLSVQAPQHASITLPAHGLRPVTTHTRRHYTRPRRCWSCWHGSLAKNSPRPRASLSLLRVARGRVSSPLRVRVVLFSPCPAFSRRGPSANVPCAGSGVSAAPPGRTRFGKLYTLSSSMARPTRFPRLLRATHGAARSAGFALAQHHITVQALLGL